MCRASSRNVIAPDQQPSRLPDGVKTYLPNSPLRPEDRSLHSRISGSDQRCGSRRAADGGNHACGADRGRDTTDSLLCSFHLHSAQFRLDCYPRHSLPRRTWQEEFEASIFEVTVFSMSGPVLQILDRYRREAGLGSLNDIGATFPELAHITQWPKCLDTERAELPERFFYTGPFVDATGRSSVDFPWHKLNGRPLVYASLGTTRKADPEIYQRIASACAGLDLQLVITLGGRRNLEAFANLSGDPIVVANAPQLDLLKRADLVITHAGPNTVLETLLSGLPMLALPLALDQPAVAARLEALGIAEVLSAQHCSEHEIRAAVLRLRTETSVQAASEGDTGSTSISPWYRAGRLHRGKALANQRQILPLPGQGMTAARTSR